MAAREGAAGPLTRSHCVTRRRGSALHLWRSDAAAARTPHHDALALRPPARWRGVRNYTSSPIYRVEVLDSGGRGTYVENIPAPYGSKTGQYAQVLADGTKFVYVKWTSSSTKRKLGSFTLRKASLPAC